jgi:hypothetical protein
MSGVDVSQTAHRGLLIPDPRIEIWEDECTGLEQAGPLPGVPVPAQDTKLALKTTGTQSAAGALVLQTLRSGFPGPDGASFVWRNDADATDHYRGWDVPAVLTGWEAVRWTDGTGLNLRETSDPHAVTLSDGTVLCAHYSRNFVPLSYRVSVSIRHRTTGAWSHVLVYSQDTAPTTDFNPCLLVLPSGRVQLYHYVYDSTTTSSQVRMWFSDDGGATWSLGQDYCLDTPIAGSPQRLRVAFASNTVLLLAQGVSGSDNNLHQYAANDEGTQFRSVETLTNFGGPHDIVSYQGLFLVFYVSATTNGPAFRRLGNANRALSDSVELSADSDPTTEVWRTGATDGDLAACVDEAGAIYVFGRQPSVNQPCISMRSSDGGETWSGMGQSSVGSGVSVWWYANDASTYPRDFSATPQGGRILILHNWNANPGDEDDSLGCAYLGGWSTVVMPGYSRFPSELSRVSYERTWLPFELPGDLDWTRTAAAGLEDLTDGKLRVRAAAGDTNYYSKSPTSSLAQGFTWRHCMAQVDGGDITSDTCSILIRLGDGAATSYAVRIRTSPAGFRVLDSAGTILGTVLIDMTTGIDFKFAIGIASFQMWYRPRSMDPDRDFIAGPSSTTLPNGGALGNLLEWGVRTPGATDAEQHHWESHHAHGAYNGYGLASGQENPAELFGRPFAAPPFRTYVDDGVYVTANRGPTIRGDQWAIDTRYRYEKERVLKGSKRVKHRTTTLGTQRFAYRLSTAGDAYAGNDIIGIGLFGCNVPNVKIYGYQSGAWTLLANLQRYSGMDTLNYERAGNTVRCGPAAGNPDNPYFLLNEFGGLEGYFAYDATTSRRILEMFEGRWVPSTSSGKRATIVLDDADSGDPASGNTGKLVPADSVILLHLQGQTYTGIAIEYVTPGGAVPTPPEAYFETGRHIVGPVIVHANDYSLGRVIELEDGVELDEARDRTVVSKVVAPPRRMVEYAWNELLDETGIRDGDPDFVTLNTAAGSEPVASRGEAGFQYEGAVRLLNGKHSEVVYLATIPRLTGGGTSTVLNRRGQFVLGRLTAPARIEMVGGEELDTEFYRTGVITAVEAV